MFCWRYRQQTLAHPRHRQRMPISFGMTRQTTSCISATKIMMRGYLCCLLDQSNDVAGTLATEIDVEDASGTDTAGTALTIKGGAGTGTGVGGSIVFQTADGAGSTGLGVNAHATRVTITDDGKVGIGTASPTGATTTTLHINGTTNAGIHITDSASGATDSDGVYVSMDSPNLYIQNKEAGFSNSLWNIWYQNARVSTVRAICWWGRLIPRPIITPVVAALLLLQVA